MILDSIKFNYFNLKVLLLYLYQPSCVSPAPVYE